MATAFRATSKGYRADLDAHERRLIGGLCADVIEILTRRTEQLKTEEPSGDGPQKDDGGSEPHPPLAGAAGAGHGADGDPDDAPAAGEGTPTDPLGLMEDSVFAHFSSELDGLDQQRVVDPPEDPVARRLLPDASEDAEEAAQFRRLSEGSLRESKTADLRTARMLLESSPVSVSEDQAPVLGRALNDIRLTLAARLGIAAEADAERIHHLAADSREKSAETFMAEVYTFITWLQETLFSAMLQHLPDEGDDDGTGGGTGAGAA